MSYNQYGQYNGDAYGHDYTRPQQSAQQSASNTYQYPVDYMQYAQSSTSTQPTRQSYTVNGLPQYGQHQSQQTQSMSQSHNHAQPQAQTFPQTSSQYAHQYQYYAQPQVQSHVLPPMQSHGNYSQQGAGIGAMQRMTSQAQYGTQSVLHSPQMLTGYYQNAGSSTGSYSNQWQNATSTVDLGYGSNTNSHKPAGIGGIEILNNNDIYNSRIDQSQRQNIYQNYGRESAPIAPSPTIRVAPSPTMQQNSAIASPFLHPATALPSPRHTHSPANFPPQSPQINQTKHVQLPPMKSVRDAINNPYNHIASPITNSSFPINKPQSSPSPHLQAGNIDTGPATQHYTPSHPASRPAHSPQVTNSSVAQLQTPLQNVAMASKKRPAPAKGPKAAGPPKKKVSLSVDTVVTDSQPQSAAAQRQITKPKPATQYAKPLAHAALNTQPPKPVQSPVVMQTPKTLVDPSRPQPVNVASKPQSVVPQSPRMAKDDFAYDLLLISLSNEYIDAARQLGPRVTLLADPNDSETYNGLIAAGLSCLEAALGHFSFPPRLDAAITFRYATLLFEETDNHDQLERILSKSILKCDRNKLFDFKYSTYHLLARATYRKNPRAALKALDTHIQEVDGVGNAPWTYALRLLRVTLSLELGSSHDLSIALMDLKSLTDLANKQRDFSMIIAFATLEALIHLRTDSSQMIINCRECIATARSLQNRKGAENLNQILVMLGCIDLACSLLQSNQPQVRDNIKTVQELIETQVVDERSWAEDGAISLVMSVETTKMLQDYSSGIFQLNADKKAVLTVRWFDRSSVYALGFLLGACTERLKESLSDKIPKYIQGGLDVINGKIVSRCFHFGQANICIAELNGENRFNSLPTSRWDMAARAEKNVTLQWHLHLHRAFLSCIKTDWMIARRQIHELNLRIQEWAFPDTNKLQRWTTYLQGVVEQGSGNLEEAAQIFKSPILLTGQTVSGKTIRVTKMTDELSNLARLNLLFLLRSADHSPSSEALDILSDLQTSSEKTPFLKSAVAMIAAMLNPREALTRAKTGLRDALNISRDAHATQILVISMAAMVSLFFKDVTDGQQAKQSRSVTVDLARKLGDPLWIAVTHGIALQGELDPIKLKERHDSLDKVVETMNEQTKQILLIKEDPVVGN